MNNLTKRILTALVGGSALIASLIFSWYTYVFAFAVLAVIAVHEYFTLLSKKRPTVHAHNLASLIIAIGFVLIGAALFLWGERWDSAPEYYPAFYMAYPVLAYFVLRMIRSFGGDWKDYVLNISGLIYISIGFGSAIYLAFWYNTYNWYGFVPDAWDGWLIIMIFLLLWSNDVGAYFVGKTIGKHQLAPKISPKKTVEGFVGGLIFCMLMGVCIYYFFTPPMLLDAWNEIQQALTLLDWMIMAVLVTLAGTSGDLIESRFKRWVGVKDSGNILPGHGGVLDRFDAFLLSVPVILVYLCILKF